MSGRRYTLRTVLGQGAQGTVYLADLSGEAGFPRQVPLQPLREGPDQRGPYPRRLPDEARPPPPLRPPAGVPAGPPRRPGAPGATVTASVTRLGVTGGLPDGATSGQCRSVGGPAVGGGGASAPRPMAGSIPLVRRGVRSANVPWGEG